MKNLFFLGLILGAIPTVIIAVWTIRLKNYTGLQERIIANQGLALIDNMETSAQDARDFDNKLISLVEYYKDMKYRGGASPIVFYYALKKKPNLDKVLDKESAEWFRMVIEENRGKPIKNL